MDTSPLTNDQVRSFRETGFLADHEFFDDVAQLRLRDWVEEISRWGEDGGWEHYQELTEHGPVLARTERFLAWHPGLREICTEGKLIGAMHQLFGEPACVFKEKINYKQPGGGGFNPHQDAAAYAPFGSLHITCLVAVDPNTVANGCLWFAPGQHTNGLLAVNGVGCLPEELSAAMEWVSAPVDPGGVLFFSSFAPHKSAANNSPESRRSLYLTYGKASEGDLRDAYYADRSQRMQQHRSVGDESRISTIGHFQGKAIQ